MPTVTKSLGEGTQSVLLTVAIFEHIARTDGAISISELAREIGTSKSRVFRHLQTLMSCDYIASRGAGGEYEAGSALLSFCRRINERHDLVSLAEPVMEALRERFGHTVIISRIDANGVHVLKSLPGRSPIVVGVRTGTVLPFEQSAQGRVALAFMSTEQQKGSSPMAAAYRSFLRQGRDEMTVTRERGFSQAQMREGLSGLAAPVFERGTLVATLALLDTASDMGADLDTKGSALAHAANKLSQACGGSTGRSR